MFAAPLGRFRHTRRCVTAPRPCGARPGGEKAPAQRERKGGDPENRRFRWSRTARAFSGCPCEDDWRCYAVAPPRAPHATTRATRCEHGASRSVAARMAAGGACRFYRASATTDYGSGAGAAEPLAERSAPRPIEIRHRAASVGLPLLQGLVDHRASRRGSGRPSGAPCAPPRQRRDLKGRIAWTSASTESGVQSADPGTRVTLPSSRRSSRRCCSSQRRTSRFRAAPISGRWLGSRTGWG